jgi:hypothetical protein
MHIGGSVFWASAELFWLWFPLSLHDRPEAEEPVVAVLATIRKD